MNQTFSNYANQKIENMLCFETSSFETFDLRNNDNNAVKYFELVDDGQAIDDHEKIRILESQFIKEAFSRTSSVRDIKVHDCVEFAAQVSERLKKKLKLRKVDEDLINHTAGRLEEIKKAIEMENSKSFVRNIAQLDREIMEMERELLKLKIEIELLNWFI